MAIDAVLVGETDGGVSGAYRENGGNQDKDCSNHNPNSFRTRRACSPPSSSNCSRCVRALALAPNPFPRGEPAYQRSAVASLSMVTDCPNLSIVVGEAALDCAPAAAWTAGNAVRSGLLLWHGTLGTFFICGLHLKSINHTVRSFAFVVPQFNRGELCDFFYICPVVAHRHFDDNGHVYPWEVYPGHGFGHDFRVPVDILLFPNECQIVVHLDICLVTKFFLFRQFRHGSAYYNCLIGLDRGIYQLVVTDGGAPAEPRMSRDVPCFIV